jgi:hypothetical protein
LPPTPPDQGLRQLRANSFNVYKWSYNNRQGSPQTVFHGVYNNALVVLLLKTGALIELINTVPFLLATVFSIFFVYS